MAIKALLLKKIRDIKHLFYVIKGNKAALGQVRILAMSVACSFVLYYGGNIVFLEPQKELFAEKNSAISVSSPTGAGSSSIFEPQIQKLKKEKQNYQESAVILDHKIKYLHEYWRQLTDVGRFSQVIFTLLPDAPLSIQKNLRQMKVEKASVDEGFELHPVTIEGETNFNNLFLYLCYIENRPEVGFIKNLKVERMLPEKNELLAKVHFSLLVGRLQLMEAI